jgi:AAA domain, putative AbiEii toxin, Type IV TA system
MLLRFRFSNVRSFKDEQELSLVAGPGKDLPDVVRRPPGMREGVLTLAALYGANASGKTNVLRALAFMAEPQQALRANAGPPSTCHEPTSLSSCLRCLFRFRVRPHEYKTQEYSRGPAAVGRTRLRMH